LKAAGCDVIRAEKTSGTRRSGRAELQILLDFLRPGDALVVTWVDRLVRSIRDLQDIVRELRARSVTLKATEQPIDTRTASGKAFLDMLGVFAEFETNLRRERQLAGIAAARARAPIRAASARSMRPVPASYEHRAWAQPRSPASWGSVAPPSIACWPGPMLDGGRKPTPQHPERTTLLHNAANLYGVSRATLYRQLQLHVRLKPIRRIDRFSGR
jgi:hypothetical protein